MGAKKSKASDKSFALENQMEKGRALDVNQNVPRSKSVAAPRQPVQPSQ